MRRVPLLMVTLLVGCASQRTVLDAFPTGSEASPWQLDGIAWAGTFESARESIGKEAEQWSRHGPRGAWLGRYVHQARPHQSVTVRGLSFDSAEAARQAYDEMSPAGAKEYKAGDRGCWTVDGVLFQWGRLVFDIFSRDGESSGDPMQSVFLSAFVEKGMAPGLPEDPR